ncbi:MAG: hypothetical protein P4N59_25305 [Negativicutes bacterium]|nr:hypothetical protein [Negativicutes bacterium]
MAIFAAVYLASIRPSSTELETRLNAARFELIWNNADQQEQSRLNKRMRPGIPSCATKAWSSATSIPFAHFFKKKSYPKILRALAGALEWSDDAAELLVSWKQVYRRHPS